MGGSSGSGPQRKIGQEWPQILQEYRQTFAGPGGGAIGRFTRNQPLAGAAQSAALSSQAAIAPVAAAALNPTPGAVSPAATLASGGALTPEEAANVSQRTRAIFAAQGNVGGNQALGAEVLGTRQAQEQAYNQALAQVGGIQNLQTGGISQLTSTLGANIGAYTGVTDPLLQYSGNLFGQNLQVAQAAQQANQGKQAGITGGAIKGGSSIIADVLPLVLAAA